MKICIEKLTCKTLPQAAVIWNRVVEDGTAFPQTEILSEEQAWDFFESQTYTGVAVDGDSGDVAGVYILHPNNVGRCGHICNASFAVRKDLRHQGVGECLIKDCQRQAMKAGFKILQFNAVVESNHTALNLYKKLGFTPLGVIPKGFLNRNGVYENIIPHYIEL